MIKTRCPNCGESYDIRRSHECVLTVVRVPVPKVRERIELPPVPPEDVPKLEAMKAAFDRESYQRNYMRDYMRRYRTNKKKP